MSTTNDVKKILPYIIKGYRKIIEKRYQYETIRQEYQLPPSFTPQKVAEFRDYFLEWIYPPPDKREELERAFNHLDDYTKSPEKLLRIIMDSAGLLFRYGRHLPGILKAGLGALRSFSAATRLEEDLAKEALKSDLSPPFSSDTLEELIKKLPRQELEDFIHHNEVLFSTLYNRKLVEKIMGVVTSLMEKMKKHPDIYSEDEIRGMEIGKDIIVNGNRLFEQLSSSEQKEILTGVVHIERNAIERLFAG